MDRKTLTTALRRYAGRRVLVTGHTGFKGSWLCSVLLEAGAEVTGLSLAPEARSLFADLGLADRLRHFLGDIRELAVVQEAFAAAKPEFVFHLAAQALVRRSYVDPKETFDTNVGGSVNILEAVRNCPETRTLVYVTSDKCYRNKGWVWGYRETDELGGHDPYSASKAAAEFVFSSYLDSFYKARGLGAASVRAGNVIGGGDWAEDRIVPDMVRAISHGCPVTLRNPEAVRPWQHVLDPVCGYLLLGDRLAAASADFSGSWNFGPGAEEPWTVGKLVDVFQACWGDGSAKNAANINAPHEAGYLQLNCDKANRQLGWRPIWNAEKAVRVSADWYKRVLAGESAQSVTHEQTSDYLGGSL